MVKCEICNNNINDRNPKYITGYRIDANGKAEFCRSIVPACNNCIATYKKLGGKTIRDSNYKIIKD